MGESTSKMTTQPPNGLKRVLGLPSLLAVAMGVVVAQVTMVSVLQGIGLGGAAFFVALIIAFVLTLSYVFTFSELALILPRAGGISTYTEVALGHFPAIIATIAGYLAPAIFGLSAELLLVEYILDTLYPGGIGIGDIGFGGFGFVLLGVIAVLNIRGIDIFARLQNVLAFSMLVALLLVGSAGLFQAEGQAMTSVVDGLTTIGLSDTLSLTLLALWAFLGFEFVCPLIEEAKAPVRDIPRTMLIAAAILLVVYGLFALAGFLHVPRETLAASDTPHLVLVQTLFGQSGAILLAVLAITATCSTVNTVVATVPRMLYGMAHNRQLPSLFMRVHETYKTPWVSIVFVVTLMSLPMVFMRNAQDVIVTFLISAAAVWLVAYIIAYIDLIVLRRRLPEINRPYRSPLYPFMQILGIVGMGYAFINNSPSAEMTVTVYSYTGGLLGIAALYAFVWVKFVMRRGLFEPENMQHALTD